MRYLFLTLSIIFLLISCNKKKETYIEERGSIFHTKYSVKYRYTHSLQAEIDAKLADFDNSLNPFKPNSIISKVNNNNDDVAVDTFFVNVFKKAEEVSSKTGGLFDITISPLINAWGFGFKNMDNLSKSQIDSLKLLVGYKNVTLQGDRIIKTDDRIQLNASAIAKGYAVDVIAAFLEEKGIKNYMIEIGGEIRTKGANAKGKCWQIGITQPMDKNVFDYEQLETVIQLCNKSMATSGDYRNYYIKDGKKYAHTIDPRTGYPSQTNVLSATVVADDCMTADAYATAFMLADTAQTRIIAKKERLVYLLILGKDDSTHIVAKSSDFDEYLIQ